jgi:hypothetical protein
MKIIESIFLIDIIKSKKISNVEEIGSSETTGVKGVNEAIKVTLDNGESWLVKPKYGEHISRWRLVPPKSLFKRERAFYLIDKQLGFNLVPLTKIQKYNGKLASWQKWVDNAEDSDITLDRYDPDYIWMAGLEDIIGGNNDRHRHNWLSIKNRPVLIDNGFSMPYKAGYNNPRSIILSRFAYKIWGKTIPSKFLERIKRLKEPAFQNKLKYLIDSRTLQLFIDRINELLNTEIARVSGYYCVKKVRGTPRSLADLKDYKQ